MDTKKIKQAVEARLGLEVAEVNNIVWRMEPHKLRIFDFEVPMLEKSQQTITFRIVVAPHALFQDQCVYDFSFGVPVGKVDIEVLEEPKGIDSVYLFNSLRNAVISALDEIHPSALAIVFKTDNSERKWHLFRTIALGITKQKKSKSGLSYIVSAYDLAKHKLASEGAAVVLYEKGTDLESLM